MRFTSVVRGELTKLLSLRSTRWTLLALVVATVGFGALFSFAQVHSPTDSPHDQATFDPTAISLSGLVFGQLAIAVLGVLTISSEYGTGAIRGTFTAVPRRRLVLAAKAAVVAGTGLLFGLLSSFAAFFAGKPFFDGKGLGVSLSDGSVLRAVFGGGLYIAASGLFGFGLGALLRNTAGSIVAAIVGLLVLPGLTHLLPGSAGHVVVRYFTSNAGQQVASVIQTGNTLGPWTGFVVYCAWWALFLAGALLVVGRRDA
jgi:ABC-2 type transport system permease protein